MHGLIARRAAGTRSAARGRAASRARRRRIAPRDPIRTGLLRGWAGCHARRVLLRNRPRRPCRRAGQPHRPRASATSRPCLANRRRGSSCPWRRDAVRPNCWRWRRASRCRRGAIGTVGGDRLRIAIDGRDVIDEPLETVERTWSTAIERYFERRELLREAVHSGFGFGIRTDPNNARQVPAKNAAYSGSSATQRPRI